MPDHLEVIVNGCSVGVTSGTSVAALMLDMGLATMRRSVTGEPRAPVCGMGICFECVAHVKGLGRVRTCQLECKPGMVITTIASD